MRPAPGYGDFFIIVITGAVILFELSFADSLAVVDEDGRETIPDLLWCGHDVGGDWEPSVSAGIELIDWFLDQRLFRFISHGLSPWINKKDAAPIGVGAASDAAETGKCENRLQLHRCQQG